MINESIWRYMSLAKYIDLISSRTLYFPKASLFQDGTEGKWISHSLLFYEKERILRLYEDANILIKDLLEKANGDSDKLLSESRSLINNGGLRKFLIKILNDLERVKYDKRIEYIQGLANSWTKQYNDHNSKQKNGQSK
jgi:hypothetical protein